jgi:hypothetical protein
VTQLATIPTPDLPLSWASWITTGATGRTTGVAYPLIPPSQTISLLPYREPLFDLPYDTVKFPARTRFVEKRCVTQCVGVKIHHDPLDQLLLGSPILQKIRGLKELVYVDSHRLPPRVKIENDQVTY